MSDVLRENRIKDLFNEALDLDEGALGAFLDRAAADDPDMQIEVRVLINAHQRAGDFLLDPTANSLPAGEKPGEIIGRYRLLELIGEGGFGRVYLAEQREPVIRKVALKVIKLGMDTQQVIARFEAERQALALMDHPNIATVFDAGATATGRPFFVMELVRGVPITAYCDEHVLTIEQRLDLFRQVCSAVQHAHTKGVIHRDIKPSNVLVSRGGDHDSEPLPKIIDFGIAKATSARLTEKTVFTEFRQLIGTPEYMSPEQADVNAADIDTRSDVYALGVLLYELLTGATPFDGKRLRSAAFGELQRIIREEEPPKPSTRLSTLDALPSVAAQRAVEPKRLTTHLRGDLDWITLKALDKDRERRYGSAAELADDIRRHLSHEPVLASPPGTGYRLKKFLRRHRAAVTSIAAVFVVLIAGIVATSLALLRAAEAAAKSQRIAAFMQQMLSGIDPKVAQGKDTELLRQVFEDTAARIGTDLGDQPEVEAAIRHTIGKAYLALGEYGLASSHLERALDIRRRVLADDHADTLTSISMMGAVLNRQGRLPEAEAYSREALDGRRRVLGDDHPDTLWSIDDMAIQLGDQGRFKEAEPYCREALDGRRRVLGNDHPQTLMSINNMGATMWDQGRLTEAEVYYREAMEGHRRILGEDHPNTLGSISNLGRLLNSQGRLTEAEDYLREAMQRYRRVLGNDHRETLASINSVGLVLRNQSKLEEAERYFIEALEGRRRVLSDDHPDTLRSINNMGGFLADQGRFTNAEAYYLEAIMGSRRVQGEDHPETLRSMHNMGWVLALQGKLAEAEEYYREALEGRRRKLGNDHPDTMISMVGLGNVLLKTEPDGPHDPVAAATALQLALEANTIAGFANAQYLGTLAEAYHQTGDSAKAIEIQGQALEILPADSPDRAAHEQNLARYEDALNQGLMGRPHQD